MLWAHKCPYIVGSNRSNVAKFVVDVAPVIITNSNLINSVGWQSSRIQLDSGRKRSISLFLSGVTECAYE